ncbi:MAG: hypothetical protein HY928_11005 [Elusimicrobia bacterium]|nr:hypothetical protein [Elusimicrobiota bacterium]
MAARAQFKTVLPAPAMPSALVAAPSAAAANIALQALPTASLPSLTVAPTPAMAAPRLPAAAVPAVTRDAVAEPASAPALPMPAAEAARPALQGKLAWTAVFDGDARKAELDFWGTLLAGAAKGQPLLPVESRAFSSFLDGAQTQTARNPRAVQRLAAAREAYAAGSFKAAAASLRDFKLAVSRPAARSSMPGRHEALLEAAARWRRLLTKPLNAERAADLAGEVRNHREAYLSEEEPGLPGYARAAADLKKLEGLLTGLKAAEAREIVDRFEEDLIHRRSLRITVVLRQRKEGGTTRRGDRFVLPGTTLGTLLKRVGGRAEKPEVRVDGGEWKSYGSLNLRAKLADETRVEIFLPNGLN